MKRAAGRNRGQAEAGIDEHGYPMIDESEADSWLYPTNYNVREYQVSITQACLFQNTLVCLPTGLGKTLIASVVMHAYYKWFSKGIVIFLAPTKPLVNQQIKACHDIMGIPVDDTAHLEGSIKADKRSEFWDKKRVFFCTPQTLVNDVKAGRLDPRRVVCVVFDEAHKATKGYAYTLVVKELEDREARFRILALSATPGSDMKKVQDVVYNLRINNIEVRTEDDPDIKIHTHNREIEEIRVPEGSLATIKDTTKTELLRLLAPVVNRLHENKILSTSDTKLVNHFSVEEAEANISETMQQISEFSLRQLLGDIESLKDILECKRVLADAGAGGLLSLMNDMRQKMDNSSRGGQRSVNVMADLANSKGFTKILETLRRTQNDTKFLEKRAPKVAKLKEILNEHFERYSRANSSTRVIVFGNLRATIHEIVVELSDSEFIRPHEFVGQANKAATEAGAEAVPGLNQQQQQDVLQRFNKGDYNVLVATSIAEEGLDIAEVDMIVFFDIVSSPIRLVQRMGRTGRKRNGRVLMLLSGSKEIANYEQSKVKSTNISKAMRNPLQSLKMCNEKYTMIPGHIGVPQMYQQEMDVPEFHLSQVGGHKEKEKAPTNAFGNISSSAAHHQQSSGPNIESYFGANNNNNNNSNSIIALL